MTEITIFPLKTTLTAAIVSASRPITFTVAATNAALGTAGAVFSCLVYDFGTDTNPTNAEAFQITSGGSTLSWTGVTEVGSNATTHANGSTVLATVITPRSLAQPLLEHVTQTTIADPHTGYMRKAAYESKGDLLAGTGSGTFSRLAQGVDGSLLIADSTQPLGVRWTGGSASQQQLGAAVLTATTFTTASPGGTVLEAHASITTPTTGTVGAATTQIATQTATGLTTFTFGGIGSYKNLRLNGVARSSANALADTLLLQINGDSNLVYTTESMKALGSVITASQIDSPSNAMSLADVPGIQALLGVPLALIVDIPNPSTQMFAKGIIARSECITTDGGPISIELVVRACVWRPNQAAAITSITLSLATGTFASGTSFTLWGEA